VTWGPIAVWLAGLAAAVALVTLVWIASLARRDASIIDIFWGPGFALLAWIYVVLGDGWTTRGLLGAGLASLWGLRLGLHILARSRGKGEDYRYREMRARHGESFGRVSLVKVFLLQGVLMWLISAPLLQAAHAARPRVFTWLDGVAVCVVLVGFGFETVGDRQLARFRADPAQRGKVLQTGLWRYTRHPNYFGDAVVWWGLFLLGLATPGSWWTVFSPVIMTVLLVKVSGVGLLEQKLMRTKPGYAEYAARTNAFVPWFPRRGGS
jgi:steroid 5-alpha reductase family enzyme